MSEAVAGWRERWNAAARRLKRETLTLYFAFRDSQTPWRVRLLLALVVGYAFSPIDLIPDFVPVLGFLDDALLLPLLIWVALRLIPPSVLLRAREEAAAQTAAGRPTSRVGAMVIVALWIGGILLTILWLRGVAIR